jgi:hypothetical protein
MHKLMLCSALVAGLLSATGASAASITLDFNGSSSNASINNFYNGGTDSAGGSGPNYGVSFTGSVLDLTDTGDFPAFTNGPSHNAIYVNPLDVVAGVMNVASGFSGALSLDYSSLGDTTVNIWSGLNGTGSKQSFTLTSNDDACTDGACAWSSTVLTFLGVAKSVDFGSNSGQSLYTNLNFAPVPLPAAGLLLLSGLGLLGARRRTA